MEARILLAHGDGGMLTQELISGIFLKYFGQQDPDKLVDAAIIPVDSGSLAFTTDSYVVSPVFFPGGDIGKLAVCGTVNDLAVSGAIPCYISVSFILEEGLEISRLERIAASIAETARLCGVKVVTGDTKVVERGSADGIFINTAGIGRLPGGIQLGYQQVRPGDAIIINGGIGEHGIAVLSERPGIAFDTTVKSDCAPLSLLTVGLLERFKTVRIMRDPTRGGLATTVKELALGCQLDMLLYETKIPITQGVAGASAMLGLDPLYLANEGKVVIISSPEEAGAIQKYLRSHPLGINAGIIGEVREGRGDVYLKTALGGSRFIDMLSGMQLPRIC